METIVIEPRFRGPPLSGNGGYIGGLLNRLGGGGRAVMMRAPAPLGTSMVFDTSTEPQRLTAGDTLIAEAVVASAATLPDAPAPPTLAEARAAGQNYSCYHPTCFCCGDKLAPGEGLGISVGQVEGAPAGLVAGVWQIGSDLAGVDGRVPEEIVWAAIDCPGSYAWTAFDGRSGGLTGTMQGEVIELPRAGDECIVMAWPLEQVSQRRRTSGVALFSADGTLMARAHQVWIAIS